MSLFKGAPEAVRLGAGFDNVRAVGDAIQQGFAQARVGNDLRPLRKREVRRQQHGRTFGAIGNDLELELSAEFGERHVAYLVNRNHVVPRPTAQHAP